MKTFACAIALVLVTGCFSASPANAAQIVSRHLGGHCLDVAGGNFRPGTQLILYTCNNKQNQDWEIYAGEIKILHGVNWSACASWVGPNDPSVGTPVTLQECDNNLEKRWIISDGTIRTPSGKCLYSSQSNGSAIVLSSCAGHRDDWNIW